MRASRTDSNHQDITAALRKRGCSVSSIAELKNGQGDLLVGFRGRNYLFEVKDPDAPAARRKQTKTGDTFASTWRGQRHIIFTEEQAWGVIMRDQDGI